MENKSNIFIVYFSDGHDDIVLWSAAITREFSLYQSWQRLCCGAKTYGTYDITKGTIVDVCIDFNGQNGYIGS